MRLVHLQESLDLMN